MLLNSQNGMLECGSVRDSWPKVLFVCRKGSGLQVRKKYYYNIFQDCKLQNLATPRWSLVRWSGCTAITSSQAELLLPLLLTEPANIILCPSISTQIEFRQDLAALCQALQGLTGPDSRIIFAGDFNRAEERCVEAWDSFLEDFHVYDVFPALGTFRHPGGLHLIDVWYPMIGSVLPDATPP